MKPPAGTLIKPGHDDAQGALAVYPFNAGFGSILYDYAEVRNWDDRAHGTITLSRWVNGSFGPALLLDGIVDFVNLGSVFEGDVPFSISCRFKLNALGKFQTIVSHGDGGIAANLSFDFRVSNGNNLQMVIFDGGNVSVATGSTTLTTGVWYTAGCVWDGSIQKVYLAGIEDGDQAAPRASRNARIGEDGFIGEVTSLTQMFDGVIDHVIAHHQAKPPEHFFNLDLSPFAMFERAISLGILGGFEGAPLIIAALPSGSQLRLINDQESELRLISDLDSDLNKISDMESELTLQ